jgi:hypothetical protein
MGLRSGRRASAAVSCVSFRRSLLAKLAADERFRAPSHEVGQWHPVDSRGCRSPAEQAPSTPHACEILPRERLV